MSVTSRVHRPPQNIKKGRMITTEDTEKDRTNIEFGFSVPLCPPWWSFSIPWKNYCGIITGGKPSGADQFEIEGSLDEPDQSDYQCEQGAADEYASAIETGSAQEVGQRQETRNDG